MPVTEKRAIIKRWPPDKALAARRAANHDPSQNPKSVDFTAWAARPEA